MHEYWMESDEFQELVLCRIYDKKRSSYNEEAEMVIKAKRQRTVSTLQIREEEEGERGGVKRQRVQVVDPEPAASDHDQNCSFDQIVPFVADQEIDAQQFADAGDTAGEADPSSSRADEEEYYDHHEEEAGGGSSDQDDWLSSPGMLAFLQEYSPPDLLVDTLAEGQLLLQEEEEEAAKRGVKRQQTENPWPTTSQATADDQECGGSVKRQRVQDVVDTEPAAGDHDQNCFNQIVPFVDQHEPTLVPTDHEVVDAQQFLDAGDTAAAAEPSSSRADDEEHYRDHQAEYPIQSQDMVLPEGTDQLRGDESQRIIDNPEPSSSLVVADDQEFYDQLLAIIDQGPAPLTWDDSTSCGLPLIPWPEDNLFSNTFAISNYVGGFW